MLANLYHGSNIDGYITTGGTEANIMGLWIGREYLEKINKSKTCLLKTELSHHSVKKAARLLGIGEVVNVALTAKYGLCIEDLQKKIMHQQKAGCKNFLVVATVGYTTTGTFDPIEDMAKVLSKNKSINYYLHVDAAFAGFVLPFTENKQRFDLYGEHKKLIRSI